MILADNLEHYLKISKNIKIVFFGFDSIDLKTKIQNCIDYPNYNDWFLALSDSICHAKRQYSICKLTNIF